jgi:hypothetical protein
MKKKLIIEIRKHNQGQFETLKIDIRENLKEYIKSGMRLIFKEKLGRKERRIL